MHTLPTAYQLTVDKVSSGASSGSVPRLHCWVLCRWQQVATPFVQYDKLYVVLTRFVPFSPLKLTAFVLTESVLTWHHTLCRSSCPIHICCVVVEGHHRLHQGHQMKMKITCYHY